MENAKNIFPHPPTPALPLDGGRGKNAVGWVGFPPPSRGRVRVGGTLKKCPARLMAWPRRSPENSGRTQPMPRSFCGLGCAAGNWMASASAARHPWEAMWSISSAPRQGLSSNSTAASTPNGRHPMPGERNGWRARATGSFGSGTTRCWATSKACLKQSAVKLVESLDFAHGPTLIMITPPPRPSPSMGGGRSENWAGRYPLPHRGGGLGWGLPPLVKMFWPGL